MCCSCCASRASGSVAGTRSPVCDAAQPLHQNASRRSAPRNRSAISQLPSSFKRSDTATSWGWSLFRTAQAQARIVTQVSTDRQQKTATEATESTLVLEQDGWQVHQVSGPSAPSKLFEVTKVVAQMNYRVRKGLFHALNYATFQAELYSKILWRYSTTGGKHVTLYVQRCGPGEQEVGGTAEVSLEKADKEMAEALGCREGDPLVVMDNVAVLPALRRRGLARLLVRGCELAARDMQGGLYESVGYAVVTEWEDPEWARAAEKGQIGKARRLMMAKRL